MVYLKEDKPKQLKDQARRKYSSNQDIVEAEVKLTFPMEDVVVELGDERQVQTVIKKLQGDVNRGKKLSMQAAPSICMVPNVLVDVRPSSFKPRLVSIGPLHSDGDDNKHLKAFEAKKVTYMYDLFRGLGSSADDTLNDCVKKVHASMVKIRACYPELDDTFKFINLAKMMVIDCCFILQFLQTQPSLKPQWSILCIALDLVLLENQIPYFVLKDIFECTILKSNPKASLTDMLLRILKIINPFNGGKLNTDDVGTTDPDHILGFLHKCFGPSNFSKTSNFSELPRVKSVVELNRAGVKFKPFPNLGGKSSEGGQPDEGGKPTLGGKSSEGGKPDDGGKHTQVENCTMAMKYECCSFMCLNFHCCRPTLRMPTLHIEDHTELVLRNFIAYEQYSTKVPYLFTSYTTAMDILVNAEDDIAKLVGSEVIVNDLGSDEEAANMINSLCKEVYNEEFFYGQVWDDLSKYYMKFWPKHVANLRRTYFSSPWSAIALLAGFALFVLTVLQTIFTMKGE